MRKKIVLTGGGTAGHITPNIALLPRLEQKGYDVFYIGSYDGMEKRLMADFQIPYYGISTGKFRRYFDLKNFTDPFRVLKGFAEARKILKDIQPDLVFSKGGFVAVPVVRAAASLSAAGCRPSVCSISWRSSCQRLRSDVKRMASSTTASISFWE